MQNGLQLKDIDNLNLSILQELCDNARTSTTEIGRRVGLTAPAVSERINKMEEAGYLKGYTALIDLDKMGLNIQAFISFKCDRKTQDIDKIIGGIPEIAESYIITGNSSMLLKVITSSREQLGKIIMHLEGYGETNTSLILQANMERNLLNTYGK